MKNHFISDLRIPQMMVSSTRKRFSIIVTGFALISIFLGYFLVRETQVFISYLFLAGIAIGISLLFLFIFEKYMAAQQVAISSLWLLFSFIGISQGEVNTIMITGFLMLTIIAAYAFYIRGVLIITIANSLILVLTGWMDMTGMSFYKVDFLDPRAKIILSMVIILVGGAYLISTIDMLGKNYLKVREFQRRYLTLFNDSIDAIMIISLDEKILDMNPTGLEITGYTLDEVKQFKFSELLPNPYNIENILHDLSLARKIGSFEHQIKAKNGDLIDVESMPTAVTDEDGTPQYFQIHMRDVRPRKRVENHLIEFKQRYEAMFDRAEYGFLLLDMNLEIVAANHQAAKILQSQLPEIHNQPIEQVLRANSFKHLLRDIKRLKNKGELPPRQYRVITSKGHSRWVEANIGLIDTNDDKPQYLQWVMRDITDQMQRENQLLNALQEMETLAMTDPLTGLHNRRSIQRYGEIELENCSIDSKSFCLILIDMDGLKKINDTFGHHTGDLALSQCAQMLTLGKRRQDAVGRWGGDEFLMVLPDTSLHDAQIVAQRIVNKISTVQVGQGNQAIPLAVSMGLAGLESRPENEDVDFNSLVDMADQSMYNAKDKNGNMISIETE